VTVDVKAAAVTEEIITEEEVKKEEAPPEEKTPPRLEEFPKSQALKEGETLNLSFKATGQFRTCCVFVSFSQRC